MLTSKSTLKFLTTWPGGWYCYSLRWGHRGKGDLGMEEGEIESILVLLSLRCQHDIYEERFKGHLERQVWEVEEKWELELCLHGTDREGIWNCVSGWDLLLEEYRGKKRRGLENVLSMSFGRIGHIRGDLVYCKKTRESINNKGWLAMSGAV